MTVYGILDNNNYMTSGSMSLEDGMTAYDTDLNYIDWSYITAYKLVNSKIELDAAKLAQMVANAEIATQVKVAKLCLRQTDYIMAKCVEELLDCNSLVEFLRLFASVKRDYATQLANRRQWRQYIQEHE